MSVLRVTDIGSFHIGGHNVSLAGLPPRTLVLTRGAEAQAFSADGDYETGQLYAQYVRLADPKARWPLLLWHGGGMTGTTWETKPDGHPGWQSWFLRAGHDVFVSDAVERGRAGWSRYPEIYAEGPHFRSKQECWELFRFGAPEAYATRRGFPGAQFPIDCFDQFAKQVVPRWGMNDAPTQAAYDALVAKVGPSVIVTHSQGGNFGYTAALHAPGLVRAVIAVEPSGAPDPEGLDLTVLRQVPHLLVLGDYLDGNPFWQGIMARVNRYVAALRAAGSTADVLDLPALGIRGNSHFPMMDRNSDTVAERVQAWMTRVGLMR
ncbi:MAG TPA: esterase [Rhodopila sp.]|uniref:esterase n=1 Tax=Rhodopila sp. TaxID=2480087 RepID=UPI002C91060C|nr:esterase [Rhodopila sp.]HVY18427.1 esterase [Rhodopila sp.]